MDRERAEYREFDSDADDDDKPDIEAGPTPAFEYQTHNKDSWGGFHDGP